MKLSRRHHQQDSFDAHFTPLLDVGEVGGVHLPERRWKQGVGEDREVAFGRRRFVIKRPTAGNWVLEVRERDADPDSDPLDVRTFSAAGKRDDIQCDLLGSALPLLIKLRDGGVTIPPSERTHLLFAEPVNLRLAFHGIEAAPLYDGPCRLLSKAWAGSNIEGEEAREWKTDLLWEPPVGAPDSLDADLAICSVTIQNEMAEPLKLEKLTLRAAHTRLFAWQGRLWTGRIKVSYYGGVRAAELLYSTTAPPLAKDAEAAYEPRTPQTARITAWTIGNLLNTGLRHVG